MKATLRRAHESHNPALLGPVLQESGWYSTASPIVTERGICFWDQRILLFD